MIVPLYKPLGRSTHQLAHQAGQMFQEKATHTGTLDPMAEGVVVALTGDDRFKKTQLAEWQKVYQFQIIGGFETDSHDLLGLVTKSRKENKENVVNSLTTKLSDFIGTYKQVTPSFSAKRINGTSFFEKAKRGLDTPAITQEVSIYSLGVNSAIYIRGLDLLLEIEKRIGLVDGNFRQPEILNRWQSVIKSDDTFPLVTLTATTSKRTYIRGLIRDLGLTTDLSLTAFSITRTQNGPYRIQDCQCLL